MKNTIKYVLFILTLLLFGCEYEFPTAGENPSLELGTANFEKFTILGGSVSSGFMDGALYTEGQNYAYAAQIGRLLEEELGIDIYTDLSIESEKGFNIDALEEFPNSPGKYELIYSSPADEWPVRMPTSGEELKSFSGNVADVSNYSIPGLKLTQIDDKELSGNLYFDRLAEWPAGQSVLDVALSQSPTLFILEAGMTDIFNYAVEGAGGDENPDPANVQQNDLLPVSIFEKSLKSAANRILSESEADLFLLTIPDPLTLPYFTQLPWYFSPFEYGIIRQLNLDKIYDEFNLHVQDYNRSVENFDNRRPLIVFDVDGGEKFRSKVIVDEYLPDAQTSNGVEIPKYRQMTNEDYFLYSAQLRHRESIATDAKLGTEIPIPDRYVISKTEIEIITERRNNFNNMIRELANSGPRIHLIDLEQLIENVNKGSESFDGVSFTLNFDYQGIISADGYTLNPKGQSLLANLFIDYLNENFSSTLPLIDVNSRRGNVYVNDF